MSRRKLIFFTTADPEVDPGPVTQAYHFATVAAQTGLEAEVRLAGDAVKAALPDGIAATRRGDDLRTKVREGAQAGYRVSL